MIKLADLTEVLNEADEAEPPDSIAIAGIYGYMGRHILDAAIGLGIERIFGIDFGEKPKDFPEGIHVFRKGEESEFYEEDAGLWHIALHPGKARSYMTRLLAREQKVTCEKPMADPMDPWECNTILRILKKYEDLGEHPSLAFDFLELFNPMTAFIDALLLDERAEIKSVDFIRSKNRENFWNPRNTKKMVDIQYQESGHCIAYLLHLLGTLNMGDFESVLQKGMLIDAISKPYHPPNKIKYPHVVDGYVNATMKLDGIDVHMVTDFKRGAEWTKKKVIRGVKGNGREFELIAEYQPGKEYIKYQGKGVVCRVDQYQSIIKQGFAMHRQGIPKSGPSPYLASWVFGLSSALWASSRRQKIIDCGNLDGIITDQGVFISSKEDLMRVAERYEDVAEDSPKYRIAPGKRLWTMGHDLVSGRKE